MYTAFIKLGYRIFFGNTHTCVCFEWICFWACTCVVYVFMYVIVYACVFYVYVGVYMCMWLLFVFLDCSPPYMLMQRFWLNSELTFGQSNKLDCMRIPSLLPTCSDCIWAAKFSWPLHGCWGSKSSALSCLASPLPLSHLHRTLNIFLNFNLFEEWVISIYKGQSAVTYICLFYIKVHNTENTKCCKVCRGGIFLVLREWLLWSWAFAGWFTIYSDSIIHNTFI